MIPSKYQQDIYRAYSTTKSNLFIEAGPGSGKTTTILNILNLTPFYKKSIFLAFNKSIKEEIKNKVNGKARVSTLHSLGLSLLRKNLNCKLTLKENKVFPLAKKNYEISKYLNARFKEEKKRNHWIYKVCSLYDLFRMNLCSHEEEALNEIANMYSVDLPKNDMSLILSFFKVVEKNDKEEIQKGSLMIDYTDMIYLPYKLLNKKHYPKYDVVLIDEIQDLNPLQKVLVDNIIDSSGRFVAVGDSRQSIYSFMGSNLDSLNKFKNSENTLSLPLSVSYRCSRRIVELANTVFEGIESRDDSPNGVVRLGYLREAEAGDFVLCRNNLPLVEAYIDLIGLGRKCTILGKDIGMGLVNLLNTIDDINELDDKLIEKREELVSNGYKSPENTKQYNDLLEKINILRSIYFRFGSLQKTKQVLLNMFSDEYNDDDIILSTVHKSKGLESERVIFLFPELIPSKYAETDLEIYQEKCLYYVAVTRAKNELIFVKSQLI